jgi:hypothetical protein
MHIIQAMLYVAVSGDHAYIAMEQWTYNRRPENPAYQY